MSRDWFCVQTKPFREVVAAVGITAQGFETFLPLVRSRIRMVETIRPLFPRYLFAAFDRNLDFWPPIKNTRGVSRILSLGNDPIRVPIMVIDEIRSRPAEMPQQPPFEFAIGQKVTIQTGPLEGLSGLFQGDAHARTKALLDILGRKVEVPISSIIAA